MSAVKQMKLDNDSYKYLYETESEKVALLTTVCSEATAALVKQLKTENNELKLQNSNLIGQLSKAEDSIKTMNNMVNDVKTVYENKLKQQEFKNSYTIVEAKATSAKQARSSERAKVRATEVKPLKDENDKLLETINNITSQHYKEFTDFVNLSVKQHDELVDMLTKIIDLVSNDDKKNSLKNDIEKLTIKQENEIIHSMISSGCSNTEIADRLWPTLGRRYVKLSERLKSNSYLKMYLT